MDVRSASNEPQPNTTATTNNNNNNNEHGSFRQNFQAWVDANYGEHSRTKTITRAKYDKICRYLMGDDVETDAKFRFWVKSKSFRIVQHKFNPSIVILCVPIRASSSRRQVNYLSNPIICRFPC